MSILRISIADMMALNIRTQRNRRLPLPESLYQKLPMRAMGFLATIPFGDFAVSIPHQSDLSGGYPLLESAEPAAMGITIVYARQSNNRYEAENILYQGRAYGMLEFQALAGRWRDDREGKAKIVPGRYAYFVPAEKLWTVILRDNGYIALDPLTVPCEITPQILESRVQGGPITVRVPIYRGNNQKPGDALPVFQQVAVTLDPKPTPHSIWTGFADHQRARSVRAQPPGCIISDFHEWSRRLAAESGFRRWRFRPGMAFGDRMEWWGDGDRRITEHEGLDFAEGASSDNGIRKIPEGSPVRAITDGEIVAFLDDFLGKTVVVRHPWIVDQTGGVFHTLYSHIRPSDLSLAPVAKGGLLGHVGKSGASGAPAHLHLTGAWIPQSIPANELRLDHINPAFVPVVLINFNELIP
jgi:murein DD-endopeptidase MepM/ murein hydrolase activator NlpD